MEASFIRQMKTALKDAAIAYYDRGFYRKGNDPEQYSSLLPPRAKVIASRFVTPYGWLNGSIA